MTDGHDWAVGRDGVEHLTTAVRSWLRGQCGGHDSDYAPLLDTLEAVARIMEGAPDHEAVTIRVNTRQWDLLYCLE